MRAPASERDAAAVVNRQQACGLTFTGGLSFWKYTRRRGSDGSAARRPATRRGAWRGPTPDGRHTQRRRRRSPASRGARGARRAAMRSETPKQHQAACLARGETRGANRRRAAGAARGGHGRRGARARRRRTRRRAPPGACCASPCLALPCLLRARRAGAPPPPAARKRAAGVRQRCRTRRRRRAARRCNLWAGTDARKAGSHGGRSAHAWRGGLAVHARGKQPCSTAWSLSPRARRRARCVGVARPAGAYGSRPGRRGGCAPG
jgi:hypothetical protein